MVQTQLSSAREHDFVPLAELAKLAGFVRGEELFDSLLVYENYPRAVAPEGSALPLAIAGVEGRERTNYLLTLTASGEDDMLALGASYDASRLNLRKRRSCSGISNASCLHLRIISAARHRRRPRRR